MEINPREYQTTFSEISSWLINIKRYFLFLNSMDQSEFLSSIIDFLQKYSIQFHQTLLTNSIVLEHLHSKSKRLFLENASEQDSLHQAFQSFIQTLNDEHQQLNQRMEFLRNIQFVVTNLQQKMNKETFDHCSSSHKNRQYLSRFLHRIQKHRKSPLLSSEKLQEIITQITDLLWSFSSSIDLKKPLPDKDHSLHLSDLSYTTDYYSENEID